MKHINIVLTSGIILLSTILLVGNRIGYKWAGGEGYETHASGFVDNQEYKRGETISSGDQLILLEFCDTQIWLDINTEIKLIDGRSANCQINVIQGRTMISGEITINTREVATYVKGIMSFAHYSWLDEAEIANLDGESIIYFPDQEPLVLNQNAVRITTLPNDEFEYDYKHFDFDPTTSSADNFYLSVFEKLNYQWR